MGMLVKRTGQKNLAKRNIEAFEDLNIDYIITNAGGCGAYLVDYDYLLKDDPEWAERAKQFVSKIKRYYCYSSRTRFP